MADGGSKGPLFRELTQDTVGSQLICNKEAKTSWSLVSQQPAFRIVQGRPALQRAGHFTSINPIWRKIQPCTSQHEASSNLQWAFNLVELTDFWRHFVLLFSDHSVIYTSVLSPDVCCLQLGSFDLAGWRATTPFSAADSKKTNCIMEQLQKVIRTS